MNDCDQTCTWARHLSLRFVNFVIVVFDQPTGSPRYRVQGFPSILKYEQRLAEFPATVAALYRNGRSLRVVSLIEAGGSKPSRSR